MNSELTLKAAFFGLILLAAILESAGDIMLKKWAIDEKQIFFMLGIIVYLAATIIWAFSLKYEFLSKSVSILTILNVIFVIMVGVLYFKENLSLINKLGIVLGIISVMMIEI